MPAAWHVQSVTGPGERALPFERYTQADQPQRIRIRVRVPEGIPPGGFPGFGPSLPFPALSASPGYYFIIIKDLYYFTAIRTIAALKPLCNNMMRGHITTAELRLFYS